MRFNNMIYFSRRRLNAFFPERAARRMPVLSAEVDLQVATVAVSPAPPRNPTESELHRLRQVRRQLERESSYFHAPGLAVGEWIVFDLEMGWSTSHEDSKLPDFDDVVFFIGSLRGERTLDGTPVDLMLCGSTEHLLKKTATAGRMGSGTQWLHDLVLKINDADGNGLTGIPEMLTAAALAVPRVNRPDQVARWVFDIAKGHHAPQHRARVHGLARVDLHIPESEFQPRLIVATPLYVHDASKKPARWMTRLRLHRDLYRRHRRSIWQWRPDLPPRDRGRLYCPPGQAEAAEASE
ncbi:SAVMC3_10250 family protein [Streptomyces sp. NBC_01255]|uniref:SAVMC3_10250 family protein n=1 Tax=Streptomyces sp. NBC_01255 TaxID=2903798 RepID=UPI002E3097CF|nr:SAVMC3_10250 family protein [Streptomyces sp. NBC_01255]